MTCGVHIPNYPDRASIGDLHPTGSDPRATGLDSHCIDNHILGRWTTETVRLGAP